MSNKGSLIFSLFEAAIKNPPRIKDRIEIQLRHPTEDRTIRKQEVDGAKDIRIPDLPGVPWGWYELMIYPRRYHVVHQFVHVQADRTTRYAFTLPKRTNSVGPVFSAVSAAIQRLLKESAIEWESLNDLQKAGALNLHAKMSHVRFGGAQSAFSFVQKILQVHPARIIALVRESLLEQIAKNTGSDKLFRKESDLLHHPPPGFARTGSFKTREDFGNLQLTFFHDGQRFAIDADIDDFGGLAHAYQVLRNWVRRSDTHPYDIHEILIAQKIEPGYELEVV